MAFIAIDYYQLRSKLNAIENTLEIEFTSLCNIQTKITEQ